MTFICETTCHDSSNVRTYHAELLYDFTIEEIEHLKEIDQMKRFTPVDEEAKYFVKNGKVPDQDTVTEVNPEPEKAPKAPKDKAKEK